MMAEITMRDDFGRAIMATVAGCRISSVIEIGSGDGTGSTAVLLQALKDMPEARLTCVEANPERHARLQRAVARFPWVRTVCRPSVSRAALTPKRFEDVWQSPFNGLRYAEHEVREWFEDMPNAGDTRPGYLEMLTDERWDAALIDGCEFSGWDDYRLLKDCVRVLMLDDVFHAYKCAQAHDDLSRDPEWACIWCSAFVRQGASIWMRT